MTQAASDLLYRLWVMTATVWMEARGEPYEGKLAVAAVIRNRARLRNRPEDEICLEPKQFSCWLASDPNRAALPGDRASWRDCFRAVVESEFRDPTAGATHYVNLAVARPAWARRMKQTAVIGRHTFFKETTDNE